MIKQLFSVPIKPKRNERGVEADDEVNAVPVRARTSSKGQMMNSRRYRVRPILSFMD